MAWIIPPIFPIWIQCKIDLLMERNYYFFKDILCRGKRWLMCRLLGNIRSSFLSNSRPFLWWFRLRIDCCFAISLSMLSQRYYHILNRMTDYYICWAEKIKNAPYQRLFSCSRIVALTNSILELVAPNGIYGGVINDGVDNARLSVNPTETLFFHVVCHVEKLCTNSWYTYLHEYF